MNPLAEKLHSLAEIFRSLGWSGALRYKCLQWIARLVPRPLELSLRSPLCPFPLRVRSRSSDPRVFHQIFIDLQYDCIPRDPSPDLIIDAGSNIGLASAFLLARYPAARLIAIEPASDNLAIARKNLAPYRDRARIVPGAVWSHRTRLKLSGHGPRDAWACRTEPPASGDSADTEAYPVADLLDLAGHRPAERVLLKMDVEGAETVIFGETSDLAWLDRIDLIAIELHGPAAEAAFQARVAGRAHLAKHGETWICH